MNTRVVPVDRELAHATLHALSQPLTVMSLALTIVQSSPDETERAQALESVVTECQRAMRSVYQLRVLLDESWQAAGCHEAKELADNSRLDETFGSMA